MTINKNYLEDEEFCLIESKQSILSLSMDEADALKSLGEEFATNRDRYGKINQNHNSTMIKVEPFGAEEYKVTVPDAIGVIKIGQKSIEVKPKIKRSHFNFLFSQNENVYEKIRLSDEIIEGELGSIFWYVVSEFLASAEQVVNKGVQKGYKLIEDELPFITGKVDVIGTSRNLFKGNIKIKTEFEEFTADIPINRILKEATKKIRSTDLLSIKREEEKTQLDRFISKAHSRAETIYLNLFDVGEFEYKDLFLAEIDRNNSYYKDAYASAMKILQFEYGERFIGDQKVSASLFPTAQIIEEGIRIYLNEIMDPSIAAWKSGARIKREVGSGTDNPDLMFGPTDDPIAAGDIKYSFFAEENYRITFKKEWFNQLSTWGNALNQKRSEIGLNPLVNKKVVTVGFDETGLEVHDNGYSKTGGVEYKFIPWRTKDKTPQEAAESVKNELSDFLLGEV